MIPTDTGKSQHSLYPLSSERSGNPGWIELPVQPGSKPLEKNLAKKGDRTRIVLHIKRKPAKSKIHNEEKGEIRETPKPPMDEQQKISALIGAARLAPKRGCYYQPGPNPNPREQLGIRVNILRRQKQKTLIYISQKTGYQLDELAAFEAGVLTEVKMLEMLPEILSALDCNTVHPPIVLTRFHSMS